MKIKTKDLTGAALDWAVAKCSTKNGATFEDGRLYLLNDAGHRLVLRYAPSTDWAQAGPILERERIAIGYGHYVWNAAKYGMGWYVGGPTPLVAAMRCFAASTLGSEIEVPEELT